jgi:archaellum biogenesis protein FlaJ (TadC family)
MDVENIENIDHSIDIENPMLVEIMPVANVVGIEVNSEVLIEKRQRESESRNTIPQTFCEKFSFWSEIYVLVIIGLAFLAGFMLFLVWLVNPNIFGTENY